MQSMYEHTQTPPPVQDILALAGMDRRTAFRLWQQLPGGKTLTELGQVLHMTGMGLSRALNCECMRPEYVEVLIAAGVPAELLPRPEYVRPGPKPKIPRQ